MYVLDFNLFIRRDGLWPWISFVRARGWGLKTERVYYTSFTRKKPRYFRKFGIFFNISTAKKYDFKRSSETKHRDSESRVNPILKSVAVYTVCYTYTHERRRREKNIKRTAAFEYISRSVVLYTCIYMYRKCAYSPFRPYYTLVVSCVIKRAFHGLLCTSGGRRRRLYTLRIPVKLVCISARYTTPTKWDLKKKKT